MLFPLHVSSAPYNRLRWSSQAYTLSVPLPTRACLPYIFFCIVFGQKFNIMSALSAQQSLTLPQKIDSREGLF